MSSKFNKNEKATTRRRAIISADVKDYSKEPFFVEKAEAAKKTVEKYGMPKRFTEKKK